MFRAARAPRLRSMRQFAEQEIILPDGPSKGLRFRCSNQPYSGLFFDAVDSGLFSRHVATGPVQSGKTLTASVIPVMYHLFEMQETVVFGLPDMGMAMDKWKLDFLPVIERTKYREFLPTGGLGSRGGKAQLIQLGNGAALRFMSGGGGDKQRAGFTARIIAITETDGMDERGGKSDETDKISQIEARSAAFGSMARVYMESTLSLEQGRTHQEIINGSNSRIACLCPHCRGYVVLEREHLTGWQTAETEQQAHKEAHFTCTNCGVAWSDDDRRQANLASILVHRGQEPPEHEGQSIRGNIAPTRTLGFRWSAVNNLFHSQADIGQREWEAVRAVDQDNVERNMCQYVWAVPYKPDIVDMSDLSIDSIMHRTTNDPQGRVPLGVKWLTLGIDVGKWLCHWVLTGWMANGTSHIVDYGRLEVPAHDMSPEAAILLALRGFRDTIEAGWYTESMDAQRQPNLVVIDSGYQARTVYAFAIESGPRYLSSKGHGVGQQEARAYCAPKSTGAQVVWMGDHCHRVLIAASDGLPAVQLAEFDADHWKSWVHERLATPMSEPASMALFRTGPNGHMSFARHLVAEKQVEQFHPTKGRILKWEVVNKQNHFLDALAMSALAGHQMGVRVIPQTLQRSLPNAPTGTPSPQQTFQVSSPWERYQKRRR